MVGSLSGSRVMRSDTLWMASHVYPTFSFISAVWTLHHFYFYVWNLVCNNVNFYAMLNLYSGPAFVWVLRISAILLYVIYRAWPGKGDKIVLYYCLMAMWTGLGDNTKLFWAVLSHLPPPVRVRLRLRRRPRRRLGAMGRYRCGGRECDTIKFHH
jgi:hypothetical protein